MSLDVALGAPTPGSWARQAVAHLDATLRDHAHCEKKAASQALALIAQYGEHSWLIGPLISLAQEELRHFRAVFALLRERGIALGRDGGDPYVQALLKLARHGPAERLVDRLLLGALVEARSAERLALLANALEAGPLRAFYGRLAKAEAGHYRLYVRLARKAVGGASLQARLEQLLAAEAQIMLAQPLEPRIH